MSQVAFSVRMDSELKEKFEKLCEDLGMNMTTAFNIFARTVVREQRIPFEVSAARPNMAADSRAVYSAGQTNPERVQESLGALLELAGKLNCLPSSYKTALAKWREESKGLFENPEDAEFMDHAFESEESKEIYNEKEIW